MKYRQLGKWGVKLSEVGYGTWLTVGHGIDFENSKNSIRTALDSGINFYDTADVYGKGEAEKALGKILFNEFKVRRDDVFVATKCFFPLSENPNDGGLSRKHIFESVNNSLRKLRTDYIDLQQCHRFDPNTPVEETCRAMNDLIAAGKILYWGVSEWSAENIQSAIDICEKYNLHKPVSNQPQYNIIRNQIETNGVIETSEKLGLGQVVWSPLAQGILTGKYSGGKIPPDSRAANEKMGAFIKDRIEKDWVDKTDKLSETAREMNVTTGQLALAWCLRKQNITSVIIGASKPEQVKENAGASGIDVTPEIESRIEKIFR
jgi:voltage-dependent potassium channel beta subunit